MMDEYHKAFRTKRRILLFLLVPLLLLAVLFAIAVPARMIVSKSFFSQLPDRPMSLVGGIIIIAALIDVALIHWIFRCPNCRRTLLSFYYISEKKLHKCPWCNIELMKRIEGNEDINNRST
jgi:hypothetical protein